MNIRKGDYTMARSQRRDKGSGSWDTVVKKGITYQRFRKTYPGESKPHEFYGKTKSDVKKKIQDFESKSVRVKKSEYNKLTLGECIDNVLTTLEPTFKDNNYATLRSTFRCYIQTQDIKDIQMAALDKEIIQKYYMDMAARYSESTVKKTRTLFNTVFNYLVDLNILTANPATGIKMPHSTKYATQKKEHSFLSLDDAETFYNTCLMKADAAMPGVRTGDYIYGRNARFCIIILYTGLRIGEAYALTWNDVNFDKGIITVNKTMERIKLNGKMQWKVDTVKRKKSDRIIPLSTRARESFQYLQTISPGNTTAGSDHIFVTQNNIPPSQSTLTRTLHAILDRAGIPSAGFGLHDLRHSFGSMLLYKGWKQNKPVDIKVISDLLGHEDVTTTYNIYTHILAEHKSEVIDLLD